MPLPKNDASLTCVELKSGSVLRLFLFIPQAPTEPENPRNEKTEDSTDHSSLLSFVVIFLEGALVLREDEPERAIEINRGDSAAIPSFLGQWHNHSFELEYQRLEIFQVCCVVAFYFSFLFYDYSFLDALILGSAVLGPRPCCCLP